MKLLRPLAEQLGATEEDIQNAEDSSDNVKVALVELVLLHEAKAVDAEAASMTSERDLRDSQLRRRKELMGGKLKRLRSLAEQLGSSSADLIEKVKAAEEVNPMLGLRGCRLGITKPSIIEMQTRAIIEAALNAIGDGVDAKADIMVPLVGKVEEFRIQAALIRSVAETVFDERKARCDFRVGTMIEIPRAALTAHKIAEEADFFSFG